MRQIFVPLGEKTPRDFVRCHMESNDLVWSKNPRMVFRESHSCTAVVAMDNRLPGNFMDVKDLSLVRSDRL